MHQQHIDHGCFVDDEQVAVEGVLAITPKAAGPGIDFEQAVDGLAVSAMTVPSANSRSEGINHFLVRFFQLLAPAIDVEPVQADIG